MNSKDFHAAKTELELELKKLDIKAKYADVSDDRKLVLDQLAELEVQAAEDEAAVLAEEQAQAEESARRERERLEQESQTIQLDFGTSVEENPELVARLCAAVYQSMQYSLIYSRPYYERLRTRLYVRRDDGSDPEINQPRDFSDSTINEFERLTDERDTMKTYMYAAKRLWKQAYENRDINRPFFPALSNKSNTEIETRVYEREAQRTQQFIAERQKVAHAATKFETFIDKATMPQAA